MVSVVPVPFAEAAITYKGLVPLGIVLYHPFAKVAVVIIPVLRSTITFPASLVRADEDLW